MKTVLLQSDYYNAWYEDDTLRKQGKPDYLDVNTLNEVFPDAEIYSVPQDVYDEHLNGEGYPENLSDWPLHKCEKVK